MDPIFTLPYSELKVAEYLGNIFKKTDGYSVLIPVSRQNKGFDLIIYNIKNKKAITIQIKSSRTYTREIKRNSKERSFQYYTWFNKFNLKEGLADFYILFGLYTKFQKETKLDKSRVPNKWYSSIFLLFEEEEMLNFNNDILTKKGEKETKFGFGFNNSKEIYLTRGSIKQQNYTKYLIENKIDQIKQALE